MSKEYIWKLLHIPTGLFYCSRKGRYNDSLTNLSAKGNFYTSEKVCNKVLKDDCPRGNINKAQTERYNLKRKVWQWAYNLANETDFVIVKYELKQII